MTPGFGRGGTVGAGRLAEAGVTGQRVSQLGKHGDAKRSLRKRKTSE